jgi:aspartyl-tRNA(Asn)/glutamyl-tRNA(Gln) amidotransferase subunit B
VEEGRLSGTNAKQVFQRQASTGESVERIIGELGLRQISDESELARVVDAVIAANPLAAADVRAGKAQAVGFLLGQVMKETRGQADARRVRQLLGERLDAA